MRNRLLIKERLALEKEIDRAQLINQAFEEFKFSAIKYKYCRKFVRYASAFSIMYI